MFCKYCGAQLVDDRAAFCHECGKATGEPPTYRQPTPPVQPVHQPQPPISSSAQPYPEPEQLQKLEQQTLVFGILGLCLSMLGVPGIVFSSVAGGRASALKKLTGALTGKALVGYRLAKAGKIVSIIMTVVLSLLALILQNEINYYYNDPFEYFSF